LVLEENMLTYFSLIDEGLKFIERTFVMGGVGEKKIKTLKEVKKE
jgi:hypothetical protein